MSKIILLFRNKYLHKTGNTRKKIPCFDVFVGTKGTFWTKGTWTKGTELF